MTTHDQTILNFPRQMKLDCLETAARQNQWSIFLGLAKVLLDAPISQGGIETEVIEAISNKYMPTKIKLPNYGDETLPPEHLNEDGTFKA